MAAKDKPILVFQTDFTYAEGAVSSMYGVVKCVDRELEIFDGTHYIPRYDVWSASYRLFQSLLFWPEGTIYVSVVDPGVGTPRRACAAKTKSGHIVITPDNGALTHLAKYVGIVEVREIDETINRNPNTRGTSVFHGRDLFGYTAARLASGIISWQQVGPTYPVSEIVTLDLADSIAADGQAAGIVDIIDPNFGNAWTNIPFAEAQKAGFDYGDTVHLRLRHGDKDVLEADAPLVSTFGDVEPGELLIYVNEMMNLSFTLNQASIVERYGIGFGPDWIVSLEKVSA